jgi:1-phosphofructokinase
MSVYTVTVSPSLDYYMPLDVIRKNEVNRSEDCCYKVGGKGINAAKTLKKLGIEAVNLGFTAGFSGEEIKRQCQALGLTTDFIELSDGNSRINIKIAETGGAKGVSMTEINAAAPEISGGDIEKLFDKLRKIKTGNFLLLLGNIKNLEIYSEAARICKNNGAKLVVDCDGAALDVVTREKPFLIKPNHFEFCDFLGVPVTDDIKTLQSLLTETVKNAAENILLSVGEKGALLASQNAETIFTKAPSGVPKNTVGAGDTLLAAFVFKMISGGERKESLEFAVKIASEYVFGE